MKQHMKNTAKNNKYQHTLNIQYSRIHVNNIVSLSVKIMPSVSFIGNCSTYNELQSLTLHSTVRTYEYFYNA